MPGWFFAISLGQTSCRTLHSQCVLDFFTILILVVLRCLHAGSVNLKRFSPKLRVVA